MSGAGLISGRSTGGGRFSLFQTGRRLALGGVARAETMSEMSRDCGGGTVLGAVAGATDT